MKKIISLILAMVMVLSLSVTAFAAELDGANKSEDIDVSAKYVDGVTGGTVYSVDVSWGAMEFRLTLRIWLSNTMQIPQRNTTRKSAMHLVSTQLSLRLQDTLQSANKRL